MKQGWFERWFGVRREERRLVLAFFAQYTCIGMLYTFGATAGDSLFLSQVAAERVDMLLAWVYVGIALATGVTTWVFDRLQGRLPRAAMIVGTPLLLAASVLLFRVILPGATSGGWLYFGLIVWLEVCALISITLFFSFAGDYFTAHDAKRVYAFMAGGLPLGNMLGGAGADLVAHTLGADNLLFIVAALLLASAGIAAAVHRWAMPVSRQSMFESGKSEALAPTRAVVGHRYIRLIFLVSLLGLACFVLVDYQMKLVARSAFPETAALASFFGRFYSAVGLTQLLFQFLLVGFLIRRFGIITCMMILPLVHLVMAALFFGTGHGLFAGFALAIIAAAGFMRMTLTETLEMPARELSLLPLPSRLRLRAQAMMGGMLAPLGQGVGGALIVALAWARLELHQLSLLVLALAVGWIAALVAARSKHRETLAQSLRDDQLGAVELQALTRDAKAEHALLQLLLSDEPRVLRFTLELLSGSPLNGLYRQVASLTGHENPGVAAAALRLLGDGGDPKSLAIVSESLDAPAEAVREAAVRAYCRLRGEGAAEERAEWLEGEDAVIRNAAIVGFGRDGGERGRSLVRPALAELAESPEVMDRERACRLMAMIGGSEHTGALVRLLEDEVKTVRWAAMKAAGELGAVELVPTLLAFAEGRGDARRALAALGQMPDGAVESIVAVAARSEVDEELRVQLFNVLAEIGGRASCRALWDFFRVSGELPARVAAGRALQRLALDGRLEPVIDEGFDTLLGELRKKIALLNRVCDEIGARDPETVQLVRDHQWLEVERLFHLLSLRHDAKTMARVRYNLDSSQDVLRANALELLEALLPRALVQEVVPLLEPLVERRLLPGEKLSRETASALLQQDPWLRVVTQRWLMGDAEGSMAMALNVGSGSEFSVDLRWAEELALAPIQAQVVDLKKVPLFHGVPADSLISLAKTVRTASFADGELLFEQGDEGDSMCLIQAGGARIEVDGQEVARVGAGEVIGEMAVIDGQPRSACCVADGATSVVEISAGDFASLVRTHASAAMAVLRTISARLRTASARSRGRDDTASTRPSRCRASMLPSAVGGLTALVEGCTFLGQVELFAELEATELVKIAELAMSLTIYAGEVLFEQGEQGDSMYLLRSGRISVQIDGAEVAVVGARDPIGEMALIDGEPRSATCVVAEEAMVMRIGADDFNLLLDTQPDIAVGLMKTLSKRLRKAN